MTFGGDGSSRIEKDITEAVRELRFCCQWSSYDGEFEQWFDSAGEVMAFMVEHGRTNSRGENGYSGLRLMMARNLTVEQVQELTKNPKP